MTTDKHLDILTADSQKSKELQKWLGEALNKMSSTENYVPILNNSVRRMKLCKKLESLNFIKLVEDAKARPTLLQKIKTTLDDFVEVRKILDHIGIFNPENQQAIINHVEEKGAFDLYDILGMEKPDALEAAKLLIAIQEESQKGLEGQYAKLGVQSKIGVIVKINQLLRNRK